jgi:hypothetical protein
LCKRVKSGRLPFPLRAEKLIQEIFARCVVDVSVYMGMIPDPLNLVLSGDGSSLRTGSSPYGVKVMIVRDNCYWYHLAHLATRICIWMLE